MFDFDRAVLQRSVKEGSVVALVCCVTLFTKLIILLALPRPGVMMIDSHLISFELDRFETNRDLSGRVGRGVTLGYGRVTGGDWFELVNENSVGIVGFRGSIFARGVTSVSAMY